MLKEEGRRKSNPRRYAVTAIAPPHPPLDPLPVAALLRLDLAALPHPLPPRHPHRQTAAAGAAAVTALSAKGGHQTGAKTGRRMRTEVTTREEAVVEEGGTPRGPRRGGRGGVRRGGVDHPGAIGSIKTETGKTKDAEELLLCNLSLQLIFFKTCFSP